MRLHEFLSELAEQDLVATDPLLFHRGILHMGIQEIEMGPNPAHNKVWRVRDFGTRRVSVQIMSYNPNRAQIRVVFNGRWYYAGEPATVTALNGERDENGDPLDGKSRFDTKRVYVPSAPTPVRRPGGKGGKFKTPT